MLYFILGIVVGVLLTLASILATLAFKSPIERSLKQFESKTKPKGSILEPQSEELENFLKKLNERETS